MMPPMDKGLALVPMRQWAGRLLRAFGALILMFVGVLGIGEVAISVAWLMVDSSGGWRERSTEHALVIGAVLWALVTAALVVTWRLHPAVRVVAALAAACVPVAVILPHMPQALGGLKPECAIAHLDASALSPDVLRAILGGAPTTAAPVEVLFSDEQWHHFRFGDGHHAQVRRELVLALETCIDGHPGR